MFYKDLLHECDPMPLFDLPLCELSDDEIAGILRLSMMTAGRLARSADLFLAGLCAEHLVEALRAAGVQVVRSVAMQDRQ